MSIRNQHAGHFSMHGSQYDAMLKQERDVILEREDTRTHHLPRNVDDVEEEEGAFRGVVEDGVCGVCGEEDDRVLEECNDCHSRFNRPCVGKQGYDVEKDGMGYLYDGPWHCDGYGCNKELIGPRFVCRHVACFHTDYCADCGHEKAQTHADDVLAQGGDPEGHQFVGIQGQLGPALKAIEEVEEEGFTCSDCIERQRKKAQDMANRMLGGKSATIAELQAEAKRLKKLQRERMQGTSFAEDMEDRIRSNPKRRRQSSETSSSVSTPRRRSSRLGKTGMSNGWETPSLPLPTVKEAVEDTAMGGVEDTSENAELFGED